MTECISGGQSSGSQTRLWYQKGQVYARLAVCMWASVSVRRAALCAASVSSWGGTVRNARVLHVACRLANTVACNELCVGPAASCDLRRAVVESSSFAVGRAGWALRRLRCWVIWVLQVAGRGDAGQRDGRADALCAELLGVFERSCCGGVLGGLPRVARPGERGRECCALARRPTLEGAGCGSELHRLRRERPGAPSLSRVGGLGSHFDVNRFNPKVESTL